MERATAPPPDLVPPPSPATLVRSVLGGALMGLANLVPGISGGTLLLASGVYPAFIAAIAEVTTLRLRARSVVLLAAVGGTAALAILGLAGPTKALVVHHRWVMYSLFVGLTLGGIPLVWRMGRPGSPALWVGAALALAAMLAMAGLEPGGGAPGEARRGLLVLAGVAAASAMILPGVSGGYLLLLLGQYVPILTAVDGLKQGLLASLDAWRQGARSVAELLGSPSFAPASGALEVLVPVGLGVAVGVVGVSNLLRWLLREHPQPTLGALLGLLLGAVAGLWPFQEGVPPESAGPATAPPLSSAGAEPLDPEDWPVEFFRPSPAQAAASLALVGVGLGATLLLSRLGGSGGFRDEETGDGEATPSGTGSPRSRGSPSRRGEAGGQPGTHSG